MESDNYDDNVSQGGHSWVLISDSSATGGTAMKSQPDNDTVRDTDYVENAPRLDFAVNFVKTGTHYIWVRIEAANSKADSLHGGLDGVGVDTANRIAWDYKKNHWSWINSTADGPIATVEVDSTGIHTFNVWMREDSSIIDKIVLTTNASYEPSGDGPPESPRG
jgi:hypothetical protein